MATFYVLPPRECLEQAVADFARRVLPGVELPETLWEHFLEGVSEAPADAYFVHREDLPGSDDVLADLADAFGAEPGDEVVEIGLAVGAGPARVRRSAVPAAVSEPAADR